MPKFYTPTGDAYPDYPAQIVATGDKLHEEFFNVKLRDIYERIHFLKKETEQEDTDYAALIENLNNNVGGSVAGTEPPQYTDTIIIVSGDSHHRALEKFDAEIVAVRNTSNNNALQIESNLTKISHIESKLGAGATTATPFTYENQNFIVNGEKIKAIVEKFDRYFLGVRRSNEYSVQTAFKALIKAYVNAGNNILDGVFETFYDDTKYNDPLSTAEVDHQQQQASGADTYMVWQKSTSSPITHVWFDWEISTGGSIEVRYHANNETTWENMEVFTSGKENFQAVALQNQNLAIKIKLSGTTKVHNFSFMARGA